MNSSKSGDRRSVDSRFRPKVGLFSRFLWQPRMRVNYRKYRGALKSTATSDSVPQNGAGKNRRSHFPARRDLDFRRVILIVFLTLEVLVLPVLALPTRAFAATISYGFGLSSLVPIQGRTSFRSCPPQC